MARKFTRRSLSMDADSLASEIRVPESMPSLDTFGNSSYMGIIDIRPGASDYVYTTPSRLSKKVPEFKEDVSFMDLRIDEMDSSTSEIQKPRLKNKASFSERLSLLIAWRWHRSWMLLVPLGALVALYVFLIFFSLDEANDEAMRSNWQHSNASQSLLRIEMRVLGVDLMTNRIDSRIHFFPNASLAHTWSGVDVPISVYFKYQNAQFTANATMDPVDASFPILTGSSYYYPFDFFQSSISIAAVNSETKELIPLDVNLIVNMPSLWFDIIRDNSTDPYLAQKDIIKVAKATSVDLSHHIYQFNLLISRPDFVVFFSVFIIILMWVLTLSVAAIVAYTTLLNPARPGAGYIGLGPVLLFAMPNIRETQPGVPPIGAFIDVLGFFWNMILVAGCSMAIIVVWISRVDFKES